MAAPAGVLNGQLRRTQLESLAIQWALFVARAASGGGVSGSDAGESERPPAGAGFPGQTRGRDFRGFQWALE